jgi:hypothetical protein
MIRYEKFRLLQVVYRNNYIFHWALGLRLQLLTHIYVLTLLVHPITSFSQAV